MTRLSFFQDLKRFSNILIGVLFGQVFLFLSYSYGMINNAERLGSISTSVGLFSLFILISDFGGSVFLKQNVNNLKAKTAFLRLRLLNGLFCSFLVLMTSLFFSNTFVGDFLVCASPFFVLYSLNVNSLLDETHSSTWFNLFSSLHLAFASTYIIFNFDSPYILAMGMSTIFSLYSILTFCLSAEKLRSFWPSAGDEYYREYAYSFFEALKILLNLIPGQIIPRLISAELYTSYSEISAAVYNLLKTSQNILNQVVSIVRRMSFGAMRFKNFRPIFFSEIFVYKGIYRFIVIMSLFFMVSYLCFVPIVYNHIPIVVSLSFLFQSVLWFLLSGYMYFLQCSGDNSKPAIYSVMVVIIFCLFFSFVDFSSLAEIVIIEALSSLLAFFTIILWGEINKWKL